MPGLPWKGSATPTPTAAQPTEDVGTLRHLLGAGVRVASGIGGSILSTQPELGGPLAGGLVGGAGEGFAQAIEGNNPFSKAGAAHMLVSGGLSAIPGGALTGATRTTAALKGAGVAGLGVEGNRWANDQPLLAMPSGMEAGQVAVGAGLGALFGRAGRGVASHEPSAPVSGDTPTGKYIPPAKLPAAPTPNQMNQSRNSPYYKLQEMFSNNLEDKYTGLENERVAAEEAAAKSKVGIQEGNARKLVDLKRQMQSEALASQKAAHEAQKHQEIMTAINQNGLQGETSYSGTLSGKTPEGTLTQRTKYSVPETNTAVDTETGAPVTPAPKETTYTANRKRVSIPVEAPPVGAGKARDLYDGWKARGASEEIAVKRAAEGVAPPTGQLQPQTAPVGEPISVSTLQKEGLEPPTVAEEPAATPLQKLLRTQPSKVEKFNSKVGKIADQAPPLSAEPARSVKPDVKVVTDIDGTNHVSINGIEQKQWGQGGPTQAEIQELYGAIRNPEDFQRLAVLKGEQIIGGSNPAARMDNIQTPYDPIAADQTRLESLLKPVQAVPDSARGTLPAEMPAAMSEVPGAIRGAYGKPENAGQILTTPMPAGMRYRELGNLLKNEGVEMTPEVQADLESVRQSAKGGTRPQPAISSPPITTPEQSGIITQGQGDPNGWPHNPQTAMDLNDLAVNGGKKGRGIGSVAQIPSKEKPLGVNATDKSLSTQPGIDKTAAGRAAALKKRQGGFASTETMLRLGLAGVGGLTGAASDPLEDETGHHRLESALLGAGIGAAVPSIPGLANAAPQSLTRPAAEFLTGHRDQTMSFLDKLNRFHNTALLSPLSVVKKAAGDVGGLTTAAMENPERAGGIGKALFGGGLRQAVEAGRAAFNAPVNEEATGLENFIQDKSNPLSWSGRAMGALTAGTKNVMEQAGFTPEEQAYYTLTSKPESTFGNAMLNAQRQSKVAQHIAPFARLGINRVERGLERSPLGLGYSMVAKDPDVAINALKRGMLGTAAGMAAYELTPDDFVKEHPIGAGVVGALGGPLSIPVGVGMALKTLGKSPASEAARSVTRDVPGFQTAEQLSTSPMALLRNYLSGYTNVVRPLAIAKSPEEPQTASTQQNPLTTSEDIFNKALSNIPFVRETLPAKPAGKLHWKK